MSGILDDLKKKKVLSLIKEGQRIDGRALDEPRQITIDVGVIPKAEGSARIRLGDTEVVCGVKIQPDKPFPDLGDRGIFICTAEILPLADPSVEPGPPGEEVIELARVVDRGIRESGMIDLTKLVLEKNKSVIGLFVDNSVTDYDGNLFDACSYASVASILSCRVPKWELINDTPTLVEGQFSEPPITTIPVSVTMGKIGDTIIVDPNADEWACMDARITMTTNNAGNICAIQKGGTDGFTVEQLMQCSKVAISTGAKIREIIKSIGK
ncbi:MAG: exosome complex protein Rrp42 [Candidatus Nitrosotenuis sp.]|uniref:Exosome complex component Rrp42 n=1 Tax=Candidatus Nitrosotenuis uzonensis TaxID=1407055 RepID=A0A812F082_9ARCH|nr:exosome complex protein Rrp42 [Candidatus Nitrosotenuis uzonensis]MCA2003776.1 exosome complex protein Rrp42 [Candidatus Nitrosotenuis sp.]CAE6484521.1 Exosome complex component Rrp42 [Candidatus Nitrosotenuis uzonensis]